MKTLSPLAKKFILGLGLILPLAWLTTGCQSATRPGSSSLASVVICNTTSNAVHDATVKVFEQEAWTFSEEKQGVMVFEREGTRRDNRLYGGWAGFDSGVWMRVEVRLQPYKDCQLLRCDASAVMNRGDRINEVRRTVMPISAGPYEDLLEAVKKQCAYKP
jgi:hypothetical protein